MSIDTVFPTFDRDLLLVLALGFGGLAVINFLASWLRSLVLVTLSNSLSLSGDRQSISASGALAARLF
jgi:ATP-binding cassette subfamily B protein RaxB